MKRDLMLWVDVRADDPDTRRRGQLLNILIFGVLGTAAVTTIINAVQPLIVRRNLQEWLPWTFLDLLVAVFFVGLWRWNRAGHTRSASYLFLLILIAVCSTLFEPRNLDRVMLIYAVPTMAASFVLKPTRSFVFAALSTVGYTAQMTRGTVTYNYISVMGLFLMALIAWLAAHSLEQTMQDLRAINRELDQHVAERTRDLVEALGREHAEASKTQAILQSIGDGVIVFDQNQQAIVANPAVCILLGRAEADLLDKDVSQIMEGAVSEEDQAIVRSLIEDERSARGGLKVAWSNKTVAIGLAPVNLPLTDQHGMVMVLRDITKEAEVDRMKSEFVAIVSHELRAPMTAIKGYIGLLAMEIADTVTEAQRGYLGVVRANADRLGGMVDELLDLSRIEAGKIQIQYQAVSMQRVIHEVTAMLQKSFDDRRVRLILNVPDDLPNVLSDPSRLAQIVTNLISNALKYTMEGHVEVRAHATDGHVQVDVADTGIGMTEEDQAKLFTRFFRASTARAHRISGTGLGLSITRSLIEMQGGHIWAKSAVNRGSTFSFTLPILPEPLAEMAQSEPQVAAAAPRLAKPSRILIVDGELHIAQSLRRQLETDDHDVLITTHGADALPLARREIPDVIVLDVTLPDVDGFEVLYQLKQDSRTQPIPVIITSIIAEREKGLALGAADYLNKPLDDQQLLESVRRVLAACAPDGRSPQSVLVVDDEVDIRHWLSLELAKHGFLVTEAEDGEQALKAVAAHLPHLILLDLKMPVMDGWTVARKLREDPQTAAIPIIVLTASPVDLQRERVCVLGLGVQQFLTKPVSVEMLVEEIKKQLAV